MKKIYLIVLACLAIVFAPLRVHAQVQLFPQCGDATVTSQICSGDGRLFGAGSVWNRILNTITYVAGAVAVVMIILGGVRYILSNGDQSAIAAAKNTILYAVIGVILMVAANAIINFVLTRI